MSSDKKVHTNGVKDHFLWSMFEHFRERLQERIFEKHDITGHRGSNTISSFFYFFFFLFFFLVWIQLREQRKGSKNKRWRRHYARLVIYLEWRPREFTGCIHRGEPRQCQRDKSDRKRARNAAVRPCARPANVNEFTCFLRASFQTIVFRGTPARRCSPSFLTSSTYVHHRSDRSIASNRPARINNLKQRSPRYNVRTKRTSATFQFA